MVRLPVILIDNGHGKDTPGKRSPDGMFREYWYAREIACSICDVLQAEGYTAFLLVKEENDVPLSTRVERVRGYCRRYGTENVLLVSVHVNAAGADGKWHDARGWSIYTSPNHTSSDVLATCIWKAADTELKKGYATGFGPGKQKPVRADWTDGDPDYEAAFYLLVNTPCTAVLSENMFQDNRDDVSWLKSDKGKGAIISLHVEGIKDYIENHLTPLA